MKSKRKILIKLQISLLTICLLLNTVIVPMGSAANQKDFKPIPLIPQADFLAKQNTDSRSDNNSNNDININNDINNNDSSSKTYDNDQKIKPHFPANKSKPTDTEKSDKPESETKIDLPTSSKTFNVLFAGLMVSENDVLKETDIDVYVKKRPQTTVYGFPKTSVHKSLN
jgi:hypothetical protein